MARLQTTIVRLKWRDYPLDHAAGESLSHWRRERNTTPATARNEIGACDVPPYVVARPSGKGKVTTQSPIVRGPAGQSQSWASLATCWYSRTCRESAKFSGAVIVSISSPNAEFGCRTSDQFAGGERRLPPVPRSSGICDVNLSLCSAPEVCFSTMVSSSFDPARTAGIVRIRCLLLIAESERIIRHN